MARPPKKLPPSGPMSPRMVSTLRFISRHGINGKLIRTAHQGTLGALGDRQLISKYGLTLNGERELSKYTESKLNARRFEYTPSDRVRRLLNYVESKNHSRR